MKILLIAGHGAGDPGATATIDGKYYKEAELTREVVANLKPLLEAYGVTVGVYPSDRDGYKDYKSGVLNSYAKFANYDYTLEIHFNACVQDYKGNGKTTGVECYWPSRGKATGFETPITSRIAKLGLKQRTNQSMQLAVINNSYLAGTPSNLLEVCFIDDADDMRLYLKNKKAVAQAIADGIAAAKGLKKTTTQEEEDEMTRYHKVSEMPAWAKADIQKLIDNGYLAGGTDGDLNLSEDMMRTLIIVQRMMQK